MNPFVTPTHNRRYKINRPFIRMRLQLVLQIYTHEIQNIRTSIEIYYCATNKCLRFYFVGAHELEHNFVFLGAPNWICMSSVKSMCHSFVPRSIKILIYKNLNMCKHYKMQLCLKIGNIWTKLGQKCRRPWKNKLKKTGFLIRFLSKKPVIVYKIKTQ